jgi:hypothetical protein
VPDHECRDQALPVTKSEIPPGVRVDFSMSFLQRRGASIRKANAHDCSWASIRRCSLVPVGVVGRMCRVVLGLVAGMLAIAVVRFCGCPP